jgi:NAD(P)-dependent dehydrogenase (short-subunit alcohol dehydrogenase family)
LSDEVTSNGVAVVTGGASGFGLALAQECAGSGLDVALIDIDGERVVAEAAALADRHQIRALGLGADVSDSADVGRAAADVERRLGVSDVVFSNVGVNQIGAFETFADDAWTWLLDVNVIGAARVARAFLPQLRRSHRPRLAFTASSSVLEPATHLAAYQVTKYAVLGLGDSLRRELADDEIAVSVIFPSPMMTRHLESSLAARPGSIDADIAPAAAVEAMVAGNEAFARDVATAEDAARHVLEDVLAGEPYVVTHGNIVDATAERAEALVRATQRARERDRQGS